MIWIRYLYGLAFVCFYGDGCFDLDLVFWFVEDFDIAAGHVFHLVNNITSMYSLFPLPHFPTA